MYSGGRSVHSTDPDDIRAEERARGAVERRRQMLPGDGSQAMRFGGASCFRSPAKVEAGTKRRIGLLRRRLEAGPKSLSSGPELYAVKGRRARRPVEPPPDEEDHEVKSPETHTRCSSCQAMGHHARSCKVVMVFSPPPVALSMYSRNVCRRD